MANATSAHASEKKFGSLVSLVGLLVVVEFTSGVLQGYYNPMMTDIARHLNINDADVNWFEGTQLMLALVVTPLFAKLGDLYGHRGVLLWGIGLTALASLILPFADTFWVFLIGWSLQGFFVVWLPLNVAIIWSRSRARGGDPLLTAKAAGILVASLESGVISGSLLGGFLIDYLSLRLVLMLPPLLIAVSFFAVAFGVRSQLTHIGGKLDMVGFMLLSIALVVITGGLGLLRSEGPSSSLAWSFVVMGFGLFVPLLRHELHHPDPLIDVSLFRSPALAPVFLTACFFGVSMLGAQAPLATFARTDPRVYGYGLGASGFATSLIIGFFLIAMAVGSLAYTRLACVFTPRKTLIGACGLVGVGYLMFVPFHQLYPQVLVNMFVAGLGSGALLAALPSAAAAAAPQHQTAMATGLTNSMKTFGGVIASAIFGIVLMRDIVGTGGTAASLSGYFTVFVICGVTALISGVALYFAPKQAFSGVQVESAHLSSLAETVSTAGCSGVIASAVPGDGTVLCSDNEN